VSAGPAAAPPAAPAGPDRCPRCGGGFACGMAGPGPCPCSTVALPADLQAALRQHFTGCLCGACLQALAAGAPVVPTAPA